MTEFKSLEIDKIPRSGTEVTEENLYWKNLSSQCTFKEYGAIDYVDFCPQEPYNIAATCSAKVQIYSPTNKSLHCSLSRFKRTAYGGTFRNDGRMLIAGSDDGFVRLFELQTHKLLRIFKGHTAATHRCNFAIDGSHIVSFSDDKSAALWDIIAETRIRNFEEHKDYIRAGAVSQTSPELFLSGSYDHIVKMYDARTDSCVMSVDHGAPVESVLMSPSGGLFISAGGTSIKVWDPTAGRLLSEVSQHHKTITCLCFASDGRRLMSGSLDRHVKIYDTSSYEVVHTLNYSSPVLSVVATPGDKVVAVGMTDGILDIRQQKKKVSQETTKKKKGTFYQYHLYGTDFKPADEDIVVPEKKKKVLKKYERLLKQFQFSRALDTVLEEHIQNRHPEITVSVLIELMQRGSIEKAMGGREGDSLLLLLKFVTKYIEDPRFMGVLVDVGLILTKLYHAKLNTPKTNKCFQALLQAVENQVQFRKDMDVIQAMLNSISAVTYTYDEEETILSNGISLEL